MESSSWAPVALFIYKRSAHLSRTLDSLEACEGFSESPIYVFADGPKSESDRPAIQETRDLARTRLGDRAHYVEQPNNLGLSASIIQGVSRLCDEYGKVIVIEDDLRVSTQFLRFLNDGLREYQDAEQVMQISGHMFDLPAAERENAAYLLHLTTSWGWATWDRAWARFDPAASGWEALLSDGVERNRFNLLGAFDYAGMLEKQMKGQIDSWAIRWYFSVFRLGGLALFPTQSLVANEGVDGSGTHSRLTRLPPQELEKSLTWEMPTTVEESPSAPMIYAAIKGNAKRSFLSAAKSEFRRRLPSFGPGN